MIHLNVGNTWDHALLDFIIEANKKSSGVIISSMYGNTSINLLGNARAPKRIQQKSFHETRHFINRAHHNGIKIAWTINNSCVGNIEQFNRFWSTSSKAVIT